MSATDDRTTELLREAEREIVILRDKLRIANSTGIKTCVKCGTFLSDELLCTECAETLRSEREAKLERYALENMLLKIDNDTRWYELFGTPERAARTIADISERVNFDGIGGDYDAILGWLRGDA